MKKHHILHLLFAGILLWATSCEMEKELRGKTETPGSSQTKEVQGGLQLTLNPLREASVTLKSGTTGETEELSPDHFNISIYNAAGTLVHYFKSYREMLDESSVLMLAEGTYTVKATLGELHEAAFDAPYYEGTGTITVNAREIATVTMDCVLANKKISIEVSENFLKNFWPNYTIILTNGRGILTQKHQDSRTAYFKDNGQLDFIIHVTTAAGKSLTYSVNLYNNELLNEYNNVLVNLDILESLEPQEPTLPNPDDPDPNPEPENPEPEPGTEGTAAPTIKVDVSLVEREYVIEIPSDFIDPEEGGGDNPGGSETNPPTITGNGLSAPITLTVAEARGGATVKLNIDSPNGLKNLYIQISSSSDGFIEALTEMTLEKQFDMMNLTAMQEEMLTAVNLSKPQGAYSNVFDISDFVPMIAVFGSGDYSFRLTVVDQEGQSVTKTLTIKLT